MATISLGEFERLYGKNKGSVQKQAQAMGFDTRGGLNDEAIDVLQKHFEVGPYAPVQRPQQPEATGSELVVVEGTTKGLDTPEMDVYTFKMPEVLAKSFDDPIALATQFLEFGEQLSTQLDEKRKALQKRADDTRIAKDLIAAQTRKLAAKQRTVEIDEAVATAFIQRDTAEIERQTGVV
jgi:hypothetical protein